MLDTELARAPEDVRQRFWMALGDRDLSPPVAQDAGTRPHLATFAMLGTNSSERTQALVGTIQAGVGSGLDYLPPSGAIDRLTEFLESSSRVYVIKGPAGCGKTRMTHYLADELTSHADVQLHSVDTWDLHRLDLATEILRYASTPGSGDPLLTLESESAALSRPCLVVVDGIKAQTQFDRVARQLDAVLRQVMQDRLRFLLVARTPPDIEVVPYPILAASVFEPSRARASGASHWISSWEPFDAERVWNNSRAPDDPAFTALPPSIQQLARLPLYMQLVRTAGPGWSRGEVNAYRLVDHCVKAIFRRSGQDPDRAVQQLADLAHSQLADLVPAQLAAQVDEWPAAEDRPRAMNAAVPPLVRITPTGRAEFDHDVIREYFLATRIASLMVGRGRTVVTVAAFNHLAAQATTSAMARNVFEFVVHCLDGSARELLAAVALSPTVTVGTTLPLMLRLADGGGFATDEVLRACARRCAEEFAVELARSLLVTPAVTTALGDEYGGWLRGLLRRYGSTVWAEAAHAIERTLDAHAANALLASTGTDEAEVATFFARYFFLFLGEDRDLAAPLDALLGHPDWRVRAALAEGLRDDRAPRATTSQLIMDKLVHDIDYKVRAAAALAIGSVPPTSADRHVTTLLADENWHVRERLLRGLLSDAPGLSATSRPVGTALRVLMSEDSWRRCPAHVGPLLERLVLLHRAPGAGGEPRARQRALFTLLREVRTGWIRLPSDIQDVVLAEGRESPNWLVRREADGLAGDGQRNERRGPPLDAPSRPDTFRRLRDRRSVQIALDTHDLERALTVARAAAAAGIDLLEVGDPLIKEVGLGAVEHIKRQVPQTVVVAEMMSADWGRDQVVLAAEAGADVVFLIGPATTASVSAAVDAGRRLGVPILLDVPARHATRQWVRDMERAGVDGFAITTNIDLGVGSCPPLATARAIRAWTRLPVGVSGGFSATDYAITENTDWDILIVGRSVTDAVNPTVAAKDLFDLVHRRTAKEADDRYGA